MISKPENASPGAILQYYREKNGISKSELADILGMTEYGVVNLEKGFSPIHYKNAVLIGKVKFQHKRLKIFRKQVIALFVSLV